MSERRRLTDRNLIEAFAFNDELKELFVKEIIVCIERASDDIESNLKRVINGNLPFEDLCYLMNRSCQKDILRILNDRSFYGFENPFPFVSDDEWNFYMNKMKDSENFRFDEKVKMQISYSDMLYKEHKAQFLMYFSELEFKKIVTPDSMNWLSGKPHNFCLLSKLQDAARLSFEKVGLIEERLTEVLEKKNMLSLIGNLD